MGQEHRKPEASWPEGTSVWEEKCTAKSQWPWRAGSPSASAYTPLCRRPGGEGVMKGGKWEPVIPRHKNTHKERVMKGATWEAGSCAAGCQEGSQGGTPSGQSGLFLRRPQTALFGGRVLGRGCTIHVKRSTSFCVHSCHYGQYLVSSGRRGSTETALAKEIRRVG